MTLASRENWILLGAFFAISAALASAPRAETLVMPRDLIDFTHASGCAPIDNFYDRPGMVNPPYVYGWLAGDPENSAAFWCKKLEKSDKPYLLVIKAANARGLLGCPAKIEWWNAPAGLSVETRQSLALKDFHYLTEPTRPGPAAVIPTAKVIVNYYDGLSDIFYCYRGQWLFASKE